MTCSDWLIQCAMCKRDGQRHAGRQLCKRCYAAARSLDILKAYPSEQERSQASLFRSQPPRRLFIQGAIRKLKIKARADIVTSKDPARVRAAAQAKILKLQHLLEEL